MRVKQAQECYIDTVHDDEFIESSVWLDKNPVRSKMQPKPFWAPGPLYGITNLKLHFTTLLTHWRMSLTSATFFAFTRVQTALWKTWLIFYHDLYYSRMDSWKPFRKFDKWHVGSRSNKVKHTHYTAPITSSQKYQQHGVSLASASAKLVDGVTVRLNYSTNMSRKHRVRASTFPDLYAKNNATQHPLAIFRRQEKALRDFSVKCGPGKLPMHGGSPEFKKNSRQQVDHTKTKDAMCPKRGPTHLGPRECETQE